MLGEAQTCPVGILYSKIMTNVSELRNYSYIERIIQWYPTDVAKMLQSRTVRIVHMMALQKPGSALIAEWSRALQPTASCVSRLPVLE